MDVETVNHLKQTAWTEAQAELAAIEALVNAEVSTPAMKALPKEALEQKVREAYENHLTPYIIHSMLRTEAVCALVTTHGIFDGMVIGVLMDSLRKFCQSAAVAASAFCDKPPCEWRGQVADAGPIGKCPSCGKIPVKMLNLVVPQTAKKGLRLVGGES